MLEESGATATVEVPCDTNIAAAKEVACTALSVPPESVEVRLGTEVLEGTCLLQNTSISTGERIILSRWLADVRYPAAYSLPPGSTLRGVALSPCGALCLCTFDYYEYITGFSTENFNRLMAMKFTVGSAVYGPPAVSRCKTRCYLACGECFHEATMPKGKILRTIEGSSQAVYTAGDTVVSQDLHRVMVYDTNLTLHRILSHAGLKNVALSDCGIWVLSTSSLDITRLWDLRSEDVVATAPAGEACVVALSRCASVFAVVQRGAVHLYDWSGGALHTISMQDTCQDMHFTPCGRYLVISANGLSQYEVATATLVREFAAAYGTTFAITPCSRTVIFQQSSPNDDIVTKRLYPHPE